MALRRIVGLVLVALGVAVLLWGGLFWTDRDKIVDAGPLEITREQHKGVAVPPIVGGLVLVGGIVLLVLPERRRV